MQIRRVRVRNIRSYESADVGLPAGTTLIAGDVGAGKSSLLYAIEMALFGVAEIDATYLIRHGAPHAEVEVELEDGEHRTTLRRRFRRVHRRGRDTFEPERITFRADGAETAYSATELRQRVIELLGFPDNPNPQAHSDLWRWAVYVPQERMRDILSARPQERLETVRKALGVERYRLAAENAQELATDLRRTALARRAEADRLQHFDREHAEWTVESDRLHVERAGLADALRERERAVATAQAERASAEMRLRESEALATTLDSLRREDATDTRALDDGRRATRERHVEVERLVGEAEVEGRASAELAPLESARAQAEAARDQARAELDALAEPSRKLAESRAVLAAESRRVEEASAAQETATRDLEHAREQCEVVLGEGPSREPPAPTAKTLAQLDAELGEARRRERATLEAQTLAQRTLSELDELLRAGSCPRCGQAVEASAFEPHRDEARTALAAAERDHQHAVDAGDRVETERRARERFERAHERWVEVEKRRQMASVRCSEAEAVARAASTALSERARERDGTRQRLEELGSVEDRERMARSGLEARERELHDVALRHENSARASERARGIAVALAALRAEIGRREQELEAISRRSGERRGRIDELARELSSHGDRAGSLADAERNLIAAQAALDAERRILVRVETRLDEAARRIAEAERGRAERSELLREAEEISGKAAWTSGPFRSAVLTMEQELLAHAQGAFERSFARYFAALLDDPALQARTDVAFTPAVTIDGEWTPAEALSGGERTSLALAFRLALAHVVRSLGSLKLETILLDEPTDGFSPEQVVHMGELLDELALPQVVIVSHEGELAAIADRVVRVEKRDGRSVVSGGNASGPTTEASARDGPDSALATPPTSSAPRRARRHRAPRTLAPDAPD